MPPPQSAPGVPVLQAPADRPQRTPALVPAGTRPDLEVQVAVARVAGHADAADSLAGAHPLPVLRAALSPQVHVDVVVAGGPSVDHQVIARAAGLVAPPLHLAAAGRDDPRAAPGAEVLPHVVSARAEAIPVLMRPSNRELVREEAEPGGALAAAALRRATIRLPDPEHVHALGSLAAALVRARPADRVLGARLHVVAPPDPDDPPVAAAHRLDLEVARPASGDRVLVGGLPDALEEHPARAGALRLQPQPARAGRARS